MSLEPWRGHPVEDSPDVLQVPAASDKETENECLVYCLWMSVQYVTNFHPEDWVREEATTLDLDEIRSNLTLREAGWVPDQNDLDDVSDSVGPIRFEHKLKQKSPAHSTLERIITNQLNKDMPIIPIINARILREDRKGGVHAVVVTGMDDDSIAINDPWGYLYDTVNKERFVKAWDDTVNQVITVSIGEQQAISNEDQKGGDLQ
ncbi:hypothetical protein [Natronorubrum sp. FCH18a]|uniref:hypothetical protein n=1 Tax=Natronorubrum sp. FCH18a TaxID=3447018 RepID=UPI003F512562